MSESKENCRINIRTSVEVLVYLDQLAEMGIHGTNRSEVAKSLISNEIERLVRDGIISIDTNRKS